MNIPHMMELNKTMQENLNVRGINNLPEKNQSNSSYKHKPLRRNIIISRETEEEKHKNLVREFKQCIKGKWQSR